MHWQPRAKKYLAVALRSRSVALGSAQNASLKSLSRDASSKLVVPDSIANGPNLQTTWPERATRHRSWRGGRGAVFPNDGVSPASVGSPFRSSGGGALLGQTRNFVHQCPDAGLRFCKKNLAKRYLLDIVALSIR